MLRKSIFIGIALPLTLLICEGLLFLTEQFSPKYKAISEKAVVILPDNKLGHRPSPHYPEHDSKGFRNEAVPSPGEAFVVALGDSQTYGAGVSRNSAWPQQLEKLSGWKTYNMAYGGYGPVHSLFLLEEALEMRPKIIVEAFYAGNDLYDSYFHVYEGGHFPQLKSTDKALLQALKELKESNSLSKSLKQETRIAQNMKQIEFGNFRSFISEYSNLYGLLRAVKRFLNIELRDWDYYRQSAMQTPQSTMPFERGSIKTVFSFGFRFIGVDLQNPIIKEGMRIYLESIRRLHATAKENGVAFLALLIPTKESVFKDAILKQNKDLPEKFLQLVKNEEEIIRESERFFKTHQVPFRSCLPPLRASVQNDEQPFPMSWDGHLNQTGQRVLAECAFNSLKKFNLIKKS